MEILHNLSDKHVTHILGFLDSWFWRWTGKSITLASSKILEQSVDKKSTEI